MYSFKGAEQAESVRAQLAFEGFDSKSSTSSQRLESRVIGPVKGKENADSTINRLKIRRAIQTAFDSATGV